MHLLTASAHAGLAPDDRYLLAALRRRGVDAKPVIWEDPLVDWSAAPISVVRSTWDYTFRRPQFLTQLERIARVSTLVNDLGVVRWSSHKQYLLELAKQDVAIVPTTLARRGATLDVARHAAERGWSELVVKPAVGAAGRWTSRFRADEHAPGAWSAAQRHLDRVLEHEDALVQPLVPSIESEGELSVVTLRGQITHAVHKRGAPGDFRVHDDYGGSVAAVTPDDDVAALVRQALDAVPGEAFYARVDVVRGGDGAPAVMELELIEPELFFGYSEEGTARMADALIELAASRPS